jgi:hypothetical protein
MTQTNKDIYINMEDILENILLQLTRIADCYENKEKREVNEARQSMKRVREKRILEKKNLNKKDK